MDPAAEAAHEGTAAGTHTGTAAKRVWECVDREGRGNKSHSFRGITVIWCGSPGRDRSGSNACGFGCEESGPG